MVLHLLLWYYTYFYGPTPTSVAYCAERLVVHNAGILLGPHNVALCRHTVRYALYLECRHIIQKSMTNIYSEPQGGDLKDF